jgi:Zinc-uptake complex component A periplasmic
MRHHTSPERFGLKQIAINGLSPAQEPKAAELAAVRAYAKAHGVATIYAETLVSPAIERRPLPVRPVEDGHPRPDRRPNRHLGWHGLL